MQMYNINFESYTVLRSLIEQRALVMMLLQAIPAPDNRGGMLRARHAIIVCVQSIRIAIN